MKLHSSDRKKLIDLMEIFFSPSCQMQKDVAAKCFVRRWGIAYGVKAVNGVLWARFNA